MIVLIIYFINEKLFLETSKYFIINLILYYKIN